jgi:hypothetical protein
MTLRDWRTHAPLDLEELEALRHVLRRLELLVFEVYFGKREKYDYLVAALDALCDELQAEAERFRDPDDCPWERCPVDNSCRPSCRNAV